MVMIVTDLSSYLFTCKLSSPEANCKVSMSRKKKTAQTKYKRRNFIHDKEINNNNNVIVTNLRANLAQKPITKLAQVGRTKTEIL